MHLCFSKPPTCLPPLIFSCLACLISACEPLEQGKVTKPDLEKEHVSEESEEWSLKDATLTGYPLVTDAEFGAVGDGVADDTKAIQAALHAGTGVVFVPSGRYRITDSIYLPKGTRLLGYSKPRPVFMLPANTPGWDGEEKKPLINFAPQSGLQGNDTFYSGVGGIDFDLGAGNPGAAAIRFDAAQGCYLADLNISLNEGQVGIHRLGSEISRVRIKGGAHAIQGGTVSWQTLIMDCHFEGQTLAAIATNAVGPTLIRTTIKDTPYGIRIADRDIEFLYAEESQFENIAEALVSVAGPHRERIPITLADCSYSNVPRLVEYRGSGELTAPHGEFTARLVVSGLREILPEQEAKFVSEVREARPLEGTAARIASDIPDWPPAESWQNVRAFGAVGDGKTDDTLALRQAIATADVLYFPPGQYRVSETLILRPESALIGLHPRLVQLRLISGTPGFEDPSNPRPILRTSEGGANFMSGIGFAPAHNPGAFAIHWKAGPESYLGDFWINWSDRDLPRGKGQALGLWIDGGGGTFKHLCMSNFAPPTSLRITDSVGPGVLYLASLEHKNGTEMQIENTRNWRFYAVQTEHTQPDIPEEVSIPIQIRNSRNLLFANLYLYRTSATNRPPLDGVQAHNVSDIEFRTLRNFSLSPHPARYSFRDYVSDISSKNKTPALLRFGKFKSHHH